MTPSATTPAATASTAMPGVIVLLSPGAPLAQASALGEVTALVAAPEGDPLLTQAHGAARLHRLWHPLLSEVDYLGLGEALAAAVTHLSGRLVLAEEGAVGPAVAERLGWPHLCGVLSVRRQEDTLFVRRRVRGGVQELRGPLSAVLCFLPQDSAQPPQAGPSPTPEELTLSAVSLQPGRLSCRRLQPPDPGRQAPLPGPLRLPTSAALRQRLRQDGLLPGDPEG